MEALLILFSSTQFWQAGKTRVYSKKVTYYSLIEAYTCAPATFCWRLHQTLAKTW